MAPEVDNSARARLIRTRRGTRIDASLLSVARRECLGVLRQAARQALGKTTYLPGWISDATDSVETDLELLSRERLELLSGRQLEWEPTPAEQDMKAEVNVTVAALQDRGAFEGLGLTERLAFFYHVHDRIRSKYDSRISQEVEEARKKSFRPRENSRPKSNPTLITEKDILNSVLDVLHRRGVLDEIVEMDFLNVPLEEGDAQSLACEARNTAGVCGCCGRKLPLEKPAYFGAKIYVGMWTLYWDRRSKPGICKPRYERTVLCDSCAPEWLSPDRDDVITQLCAHCERPMVSRLKLSTLRRTFCSDPCQQAYHNQLRRARRAEDREKVCEVCGEKFTATRRDAKSCSDGCKQKAYRRRKRAGQQNR